VNNTCPSCGAVYNVAAKDVGRKIKCKKCSTPLLVSDAGLVVDAPPPAVAVAAAPVPAAAVVDDFAVTDADAVVAPKRGAKPARSYSGGGGGLDGIGGIPTILFSLGTFLVIFFAFMPVIGDAATERAKAGIDRVKLDGDAKAKKFLPKGKTSVAELTPEELTKFREDAKKIGEEYPKLLAEAQENYEQTKNSNKRSAWLEKYGLMFGFLFLSFGCIGYLRSQQPLTLRIVAAVVLGAALLLIFASSLGGCGGRVPPIS
jgi:predicted Zn finger-like uncharacterized protein